MTSTATVTDPDSTSPSITTPSPASYPLYPSTNIPQLPYPSITQLTEHPLPTPSVTPVINDGTFFPVANIQLAYDPSKWTKGFLPFTPGSTPWSPHSWVRNTDVSLMHNIIPDCWIGTNYGRGLSDNIELRQVSETLGEHTYSKLEFYDVTSGSQYAFAVYDTEIAVEFPMKRELCLADIRDVLATYARP